MAQATVNTLGAGSTVGGYGNNSDPNGTQMVAGGGQASALAINAAAGVIKGTAGRLVSVALVTSGSSGTTISFYDAATTTAAATSVNGIFTLGTSTQTITASVFKLDWPCTNGICFSIASTVGAPAFSASFN